MHRFMFRAMGLTLALAAAAKAHPGPRIWVSIVNGKVTTYSGPYPPGAPSSYNPSRVFTQTLTHVGKNIWETDFPGYQKVPGGAIPVATTFRYNIMGPLLWYVADDPTQCPFFDSVANHFAVTPLVPQMAVTNELFQTQYTSTGFVAGDPVYVFHGSDGDHNHLTYTLLGDGSNPGGGPNGIYALQLQLAASGFTPSDTFYLLLGKNVTAADLADAADGILADPSPYDIDCDDDIDVDDFRLFHRCESGPMNPLPPPGPGSEHCVRADFDGDSDVDLLDFGAFLAHFGDVD